MNTRLLLFYHLMLAFMCGMLPARAADPVDFFDAYSVRCYTMGEGLPNNHVDDIYKDSKGFVWVATAGGGLSRFDGYDFINFNDADAGRMLRSNFVRSVAEDRFGRLWVSSEEGVDVIDLATFSVVQPDDLTGQFAGISGTVISDVTADSTGALWLGGPQVLYRIDFDENGSISTVSSLPVPGAYHRGIVTRDVDRNGSVWMGIGNSVRRVRALADGSLSAAAVSGCLEGLPEVEYFSDFELKDGEVWISTNHGLYRYNPNSDSVKHYLSKPGDARSLSQNFLTDLAVTDKSQLLVASLKGLNVYNPMTDDFERAGDSDSRLNNQFINMLMVDGNRIFVGTEGGGVNMLSPRRLNVLRHVHSDLDPRSLSRNPVNAIAEAADGTVFVGTVEGGLNVMRPGDGGFQHITTADGRLGHNSVSALAIDGRGRLWVGTWGGGIDVLSASGGHEPLMRLSHSTTGMNLAFIGALEYDSVNDGMLIGSNMGLLYYDMHSGLLSNALAADSNVDAYGFVGSITDRNKRLWMGSARGLVIIDPKEWHDDGTFGYRFMRTRLDDPDSKVVEKPTCFYEAPDGTMWVGTNGHGVYRGVPDDSDAGYRFENLTTADGLSNNAVRGIVGDDWGNVWISTINGLSRYNVEAGHFANFGTGDGLPGNQFYWNAARRMSDGSLMFGTTCGIAVINPKEEHNAEKPRGVVFTKLNVGNKPMTAAEDRISNLDIAYSKGIRLHESDKSLSVEFSALDFEQRDNTMYSYRLKGFDDEWITVQSDRHWANYTNLPAGDYVLQVKYMPDGNDNNVPVTELPVKVSPYFFKSWWFIMLVFLLLAVTGVIIYKLRVNGLKQQRQRLKVEVERSTSQLAEQKQLVEHRANELAQRNEELTARNEEINRQKAQLTEMNRQVSQMTMDRISFFTSITHEFRTPITLIIGPIERALRLSTNPKVIEQLQFVERNSKYLLTLINQLMDFRKIESGKMDMSYTSGDMPRFIEDIVTPFRPLAQDRGITLRCLYHMGGRSVVTFDEEATRKVVINLLSNAIKFTPDNGVVTIYLAYIQNGVTGDDGNTQGCTYLAVSDTGCGISPNDADRIFDRFYQGEGELKYPLPGAGDSGIGLYLCRSIVELHGGTITARNNRRAGCTFRVITPVPELEIPAGMLPAGSQEGTPGSDVAPDGETVVLVVEDNDDMRRYICSVLGDNYSLLEARNGAEALKVLNEHNVDFIVSDLMMPVMDGVELSRRVKDNFATSHIPFLMLTAKTSTESRIDSYRIGVDDYLLKPFDEHVLLARIEGILRNRRRLQHTFGESMDAGALDIAAESRDKKFIDQVMETVKANYKNSYFEVGDFADALGISRSLLNKKLQSLMGQSAVQLMRNYRLNMAREIIIKNRETRALNISEIAYEVGFNDSKYFTRCFTKHYNVTPSAMMNG